jgi:hypothetical protein
VRFSRVYETRARARLVRGMRGGSVRRAFLLCGRSKGVFIETVEERAAKAEARRNRKFDGSAGIYDIRPDMDAPTLGFKYVRIPCDDAAPFEQLDGLGYDACDNFLTMLRPKFAGGNVDADKAQRAAVQHLGASVPTLGEKGMSTLADAGLSAACL